MSLRILTVVSTGLLAAAAGCASGEPDTPFEPVPPPVRAGLASLTVATAPADLSALRLRIVAPGMGEARAMGGTRILVSTVSGDTLRLLVNSMPTGAAFAELPLAREGTTVSVLVEDAAAGRTSGYRTINVNEVNVVRGGT
jgi:hypothetical protein